MKRDETGIALVITLFLMATLSALAVSMMFLAQTETAASRNYRTMSQARYGAEAGVHEMVNYLMNTGYVPTGNYDATKSPVTCTGGSCAHTTASTCTPTSIATAVSTGCVVVGYSTATTNNPDATVHTPTSNVLATNSSGSKTNGAAGTVTYTAAAVLMAMRSVVPYGSSGSSTIETWQIISDGTVPPSTSAIVEVSSSLEREFGSANTFAVFATGTGCGAISLSGNVSTASYNGTTVSTALGNVGTNGNMSIQGHVDVHGSLSSPRTGIGSCTNGSNVTALTEQGAATVDNNALVTLSQALTFPTPTIAASPTTSYSTAAQICTAATAQGALCTVSGSTATVDPMGNTISLGNISTPVVLKGGTYNINSIGNVAVTTGTSALGATDVTIALQGKNTDGTQMASPFGLTSQTIVNSSMDASRLQVLYAGTGNIDMTGGSTAAMLLYAPNATVTTHGNADIYGSLLVAGVTSAGTPRFIYDTRLNSKIVTLGNFMLTSFSWKKY